MRALRWLLPASGVLLVAWLLWPDGERREPPRPPPLVELTTVSPREIDEVIATTGTLVAPESVTVTAETRGRVEEVHFREGGAVERGEVLIALDRARQAARVEEMQARVEETRRDLERLQALEAADVAARARVEEARTAYAEARAGLRVAEEDLADRRIEAPFVVQPVVLLAGVPLATAGGLAALALSGGTLNLFSQIGLILAIGIMAKNAILLVEFANQLRDRGREFREALEEAARTRFRPIVMTSIATLFGAVPLAFAFGPGAEIRSTLGLVVIGGVLAATALALWLVPVLYLLLARGTRSRAVHERELARQRREADETSPGTRFARSEESS